jgi:glucan biosynthesis protein
MFLFGPNQPSPATNYRPELHDSNGLSIHAGNGEWIWRPLNNPKHLAVSSLRWKTRRALVCCSVVVSSPALKI